MANNIDPKFMTKEMLEKAMACETPEALMKLAKDNGLELTAEQAKGYLAQLEDVDVQLTDEQLLQAAGGKNGGTCWSACDDCPDYCYSKAW